MHFRRGELAGRGLGEGSFSLPGCERISRPALAQQNDDARSEAVAHAASAPCPRTNEAGANIGAPMAASACVTAIEPFGAEAGTAAALVNASQSRERKSKSKNTRRYSRADPRHGKIPQFEQSQECSPSLRIEACPSCIGQPGIYASTLTAGPQKAGLRSGRKRHALALKPGGAARHEFQSEGI